MDLGALHDMTNARVIPGLIVRWICILASLFGSYTGPLWKDVSEI